jgi:hypothetical protein
MQRHRHQEFIRFLNAIEADMPASKMVHSWPHRPVNLKDVSAKSNPMVLICTVSAPLSSASTDNHALAH